MSLGASSLGYPYEHVSEAARQTGRQCSRDGPSLLSFETVDV